VVFYWMKVFTQIQTSQVHSLLLLPSAKFTHMFTYLYRIFWVLYNRISSNFESWIVIGCLAVKGLRFKRTAHALAIWIGKMMMNFISYSWRTYGKMMIDID
jgi:hypothetical protein